MLVLRFQRVGKKHDATYRIVAVDSRFSATSGKIKENLGWWNPRKDKFELNTERIKYWLQQGAQVSDSCFNLLVDAKIIESKKRPINISRKKSKENETELKTNNENPTDTSTNNEITKEEESKSIESVKNSDNASN